ncbi:MAG: glycosyltransferase [Candidatus Nanopelagicales bacterium]
MRTLRTAVWVTSALAVAGALHAAINRRHLAHLQPRPDTPANSASVSVLVPARDEADVIDDCLDALRSQRGVDDLEVVVLDDGSTDDTAARVARHAARDPRIRLVTGAPGPPPGWLGKPHACSQLADTAGGDVLVFVDADVRLEPDAVAAAVAHRSAVRADLLSAWPRQLGTTALARMVQPLQQWSWLTTVPLGSTARRPSQAVANGQFLVITRAAYDRCGGHAAVAGEVLEDISLARAVRRSGGDTQVVDASAVAQCLMYADDRALVAGYTKSLWRAFGGPARGLAVTTFLATGYALPPAYTVLGRDRATRAVAGLGYAAAVANRVITARATGGEVSMAATHPLGMLALLGLTVRSVHQLRAGTLRWRGRPVRAKS